MWLSSNTSRNSRIIYFHERSVDIVLRSPILFLILLDLMQVNDVVLAILTMRERFKRVLYIDFDVHHGDGVEEAFYYSSEVCTLSLHKYSAGFYPHTGSLDNIGKG